MPSLSCGYIDRPRARLDYYPTAGSAPIVYALADRGARLLVMHGELDASHIEWSRKNREAGRPFIEHQLEIADFEVATQLSTERSGYHYIDADEIVFKSSTTISNSSNPISVRVVVSHRGARHDIGLTPDLAFAVELKNGTRRDFLVEIDRGTMPISRADFLQTSIERKLRCYLSAHASRVFERKFGWKFFRVLIVTSNDKPCSFDDQSSSINPTTECGRFASRDDLRARDPFSATWRVVNGQIYPLAAPSALAPVLNRSETRGAEKRPPEPASQIVTETVSPMPMRGSTEGR